MKVEQFNDKLHRLFGTYGSDEDYSKINSPISRIITFQLTEACNLICGYCYQHEKRANSMTFDVAKQLIDDILLDNDRTNGYYSSQNSPGVILDFIGGEPFLEVELMDQITDYFISKCIELRHPWATRYMISISSNGMLYFDERVQNYIKKNRRRLSLSISVDGNKELHDSCRVDVNGNGSYDRAIAAVRHYREHWQGFMGSKVTLSPYNVKYTAEAIIAMIEEGYDSINFNVVYEEGWTIEHAKIYYEQLKKLADYLLEHDTLNKITINSLTPMWGHPMRPEENRNWCGSAGQMLAVDYKGDLFPCIRFMDSSLNGAQEPFVIGNIYEGIGKTEATQSKLDTLSEITRRSMSTDECFNCPIATGCAWCNGYCYEVYGTPNKRTTYACDMMKARTLALCYLWNNYYIDNNIKDVYSLDIPDEWALTIIDENELNMLKKLTERG